MKILLIGGTGTISLAISNLLAARGHQLFLLNRGSKPGSLPPGATLLQADMQNETEVRQLLAGRSFDAVANFIAYEPAQVERDYRLFAGKTGQYIFISSASAYQKPLSNYLVTESTPLANPYWQYSRNKIACEEMLMGHYRQSAFPVTIVRPSHTYGPGGVPVGLHGQGGSWQVLQRMRQGRPILIHGDGSSLWTFTHNTDFAAAFAGLVGNPHAVGEAVHITSDESLTWNQAYAIIAAALGVPLKATYAPSHFLAASGKSFGYDFEGSLLGDKATSVVFDNTKIKRLVPGWAAVKRFDEGVRESVANLLANPALQTPDPAFDLYCEKVEAALQNALGATQP